MLFSKLAFPNILDRFDIIDTGLKLFIDVIGPDLQIGLIKAFLSCGGKMPEEIYY